MGSMPRLKIKKELNYRRSRKNANCSLCIYVVEVLA